MEKCCLSRYNNKCPIQSQAMIPVIVDTITIPPEERISRHAYANRIHEL